MGWETYLPFWYWWYLYFFFFFFFSPQHVTILQVPWEQKSFSQHCCKMEKQKSFFWHCCCKVEKALESGRLCFNPGSVTYQLWLSSFLICEIDIIILIAFFFFPFSLHLPSLCPSVWPQRLQWVPLPSGL